MGMSDVIAGFIVNALNDADGCAELQRAELANRFKCVPSQINYVISTRFSPEHGYIVESRRGGGGFIRITRVEMEPERLIMHTVNAIGEAVSQGSAEALTKNLLNSGAIDQKLARMILAAVGCCALRPVPAPLRDIVRASIFKQMLINVI
ncbi:CtsR family transcriptional regulator [Oscillospiraceae bacterium WX1]